MRLVLFALKQEMKSVLGRLKSAKKYSLGSLKIWESTNHDSPPLLFCQTGMGSQNIKNRVPFLLNSKPVTEIISIGYSGACIPTLKTGDCVLPDSIVDEEGNSFKTDSHLRKYFIQTCTDHFFFHQTGKLLSLSAPACTKEQKKNLGERGFDLIDMETSTIAQLAKNHTVPLLSIRIVFDPLDEELPLPDSIETAENPATNFLKNPKSILKIPKFIQMHAKCQGSLLKISGSGFI